MVTNSNNPLPPVADDGGFTDIWPAFYTPRAPKICGIVDLRGRVCGNWNGHEDKHSFVPRTVRED